MKCAHKLDGTLLYGMYCSVYAFSKKIMLKWSNLDQFSASFHLVIIALYTIIKQRLSSNTPTESKYVNKTPHINTVPTNTYCIYI